MAARAAAGATASPAGTASAPAAPVPAPAPAPAGTASATAAPALAGALALPGDQWTSVEPEGTEILARSLFRSKDKKWYAKLIAAGADKQSRPFLDGHQVLSEWKIFGTPYNFVAIPNYGPTLFDQPPRLAELRPTALALVRLVLRLAERNCAHNDVRSPNIIIPNEQAGMRLIDFDRCGNFDHEFPNSCKNITHSLEKPIAVEECAPCALHQCAVVVARLARLHDLHVRLPQETDLFLFTRQCLESLPSSVADIMQTLLPPGYHILDENAAIACLRAAAGLPDVPPH
eukprot:GAFH01002539.1.p1 GENE.GAFH01002539.1~~GAFH01002539.1.p1  ORF type:complete len:333 (-),score=40.91 GAFH01002539.1:138-1001(-)